MLFIAFVTALAGCIGVSTLTYFLFWYEAVNTPCQITLEACAGRKGILQCILRGYISSVCSQLLVCITYPLGFAKPLWKPAPSRDGARPPVLLVHGLYHNASAWLFYKWLLRQAGFETAICFSYNSLKAEFWPLTAQLKDALRETSAMCDGKQVICIGHSLGGLLIRAALADPDAANLVLAAVILGTPNHGSRLAALAVGKLGRSILHRSELINAINTTRSPARLPKLNVISPIDNMVTPTSALRVPEPGWVELTTAPISHVSMLYHLPSARLVLSFLESALSKDQSAGLGKAGHPNSTVSNA